MLEAGAVRELGVISAVKNQEYGFIRAQDRKDEIYFRIDDVVSTNANSNELDNAPKKDDIKEGVEVEFFVIAEMIRGKLCERAIHLSVIPSGTVQFEVVVATDLPVHVVMEPGMPPADEVPGLARIVGDSLNVEKFTKTPNMEVKQLDLWSRCMPEDLILRKGDLLKVNLHYYRPEKIFFARNVRVMELFPLGRDTGTIVTIKEGSFGFIKSEMRKCDLYFRTNQVLSKNGTLMKEQDLRTRMVVSFDSSIEDGTKLRAARVQIVNEDENDGSNEEALVMEKNIIGVVVRSANKREAVGLID